MFNLRKTLFSAAVSLAVASMSTGASAAAIAGLFNTGVDAGSSTTVGNGAEVHWTLNELAPYTGVTNGVFPTPYWLSDNTTSRWITPTANAADSFDPSDDGYYNFGLSFSLTAAEAAGASFLGRFAADNIVDDIRLNGNSLGNGGGFGFWTDFAANSSSFVTGDNFLLFQVRNYKQNGGNPAGLRVEFQNSAVGGVPEPATWAMMITGFGIAGVALRRRREANLVA